MKNEIRQINKQKRNAMAIDEVAKKSSDAAELFLSSSIYKNSKCIMLYMPLGNETDTSKIMTSALFDKKELAYPVTNGDSGIITPYKVTDKTRFERGAFSVLVPKESEKADLQEIDAVIVPGIAFDKKGARVGFGKGCYDRFLKNMSALKIGYCYAYQITDDIKTDEFDVLMDYIITENEILDCKNPIKGIN